MGFEVSQNKFAQGCFPSASGDVKAVSQRTAGAVLFLTQIHLAFASVSLIFIQWNP